MKISNYEIDVGYTKSSDMFTIYRSIGSDILLQQRLLEIKEKELKELIDSGHKIEDLRVVTQISMFDGKVIYIYDKEKCIAEINVSIKFKKTVDRDDKKSRLNFS